jgi:hypothetical protein
LVFFKGREGSFTVLNRRVLRLGNCCERPNPLPARPPAPGPGRCAQLCNSRLALLIGCIRRQNPPFRGVLGAPRPSLPSPQPLAQEEAKTWAAQRSGIEEPKRDPTPGGEATLATVHFPSRAPWAKRVSRARGGLGSSGILSPPAPAAVAARQAFKYPREEHQAGSRLRTRSLSGGREPWAMECGEGTEGAAAAHQPPTGRRPREAGESRGSKSFGLAVLPLLNSPVPPVAKAADKATLLFFGTPEARCPPPEPRRAAPGLRTIAKVPVHDSRDPTSTGWLRLAAGPQLLEPGSAGTRRDCAAHSPGELGLPPHLHPGGRRASLRCRSRCAPALRSPGVSRGPGGRGVAGGLSGPSASAY